ncbi:hypothetical protein [Vibrio parahaemolyticus]|uniref:hypothetical protein n=1 Tax=Vibrio parahaemolyticus TaxID=670 RepID=UPI0024051307|nr:hypothetical protein [Vibrio parahaemolyticus]
MIKKIRKLSLYSRISNLFYSAPTEAPVISDLEKEGGNIPLTIRFDPEIHKFYSAQAEHLGISIQSVVSMLLKSVMSESISDKSSQLNSVCQRFRFVFEMHGISEFDIPKILPEIKKSELLDDILLIDCLTEDVLDKVSTLFNINKKWLKGSDEEKIFTLSSPRWYKSVKNVVSRIYDINISHSNTKLYFLSTKKEDTLSDNQLIHQLSNAVLDDSNNAWYPFTIAVEFTKNENGVEVPVVEFYKPERWNYSKCRYHIGMLYLFAKNMNIQVNGYTVDEAYFERLQNNEFHPVNLFNLVKSKDVFGWNVEKILSADGVFSEGQLEAIKSVFDNLAKGVEDEYFCESYMVGISKYLKKY